MRLFSMNFDQARQRLVQAGAALAAAALVAGCGNNYRPVITPANPSGPAAQPVSYAVVVSAPSSSTPGIATIVDYAGDTVMAEAAIGPGPSTLTVDVLGASGYTLNSDGTLTNFPVSRLLQEKQVAYTTLPSTAETINLFSSSSGLWAADLCVSDPITSKCSWDSNPLTLNFSGADVFTGNPQTFLRSIPLPPTPVAVLGSGGFGQRVFGISQGNSPATSSNGAWNNIPSNVACNTPSLFSSNMIPNGETDGIELSSYTVSSHIPLGKCPVYAVESTDLTRLFVLNRGSDTISVINVVNDTPDTCSGLINQAGQPVTCHPTLPLSTTAMSATGITPPNCNLKTDPTCGGMTATAGPVYAEYNAATSQLIVANYDGSTISVIDVSLDEWGNDSATFGTTFTIPVGNNPASVTVLYDGSRAYTANQTDSTVSIVNLSSHTVEKAALPVMGHPRTVVSTQNSSYGKVYAASPDSPYLTIIRTDEDIVDTTVLVQGNIVDVRVSTQNGVSSNINNISRIPGYGEPCNLPLSEFNPASSSNPAEALYDCQVQDTSSLK
jgi:DNA-binding beta-propeller fold protein YncE